MPTYTAEDAHCHVYSFKEGLFSAAGHDVKLQVQSFELEVGPDGIVGTFDPKSIRVVCAMKRGRENPGALSRRDVRTIEGYVSDDILHVARHPTIRWRSTGVTREGPSWRVEGELTLHGQTRSMTARAALKGGRVVTRMSLHQPDFGITPFRAMLGALKIKPTVEVELSVPASDGLPS